MTAGCSLAARVASGVCWLGLVAACGGKPAGPVKVIVPAPSSGDEGGFVISRRLAKPAGPPAELPPIHPQEEWWPYRSGFLGISEQKARERDAAVTERQPPAGFWDDQTGLEALHLWTALCNECHGGRRRPEDVAAMPPPSPAWGRAEGVYFGKLRPYAELFRIVYSGGPERDGKESEMPPWRGKIAKEQIWALLYFLEYQSGGLDGPVPPSLRPRRQPER